MSVNQGGWKIGYFPFGDQNRRRTGRGYFYRGNSCEYWWICDLEKRASKTSRFIYGKTDPNVIALSIFQEILINPLTPPNILEKTLHQVANIFIGEPYYFPSDESYVIYLSTGVASATQFLERVSNLMDCEGRYSYINIFDYSNRDYEERWDKYQADRDGSLDYMSCVAKNEEIQSFLDKIESFTRQYAQKQISDIIIKLQKSFPQSTDAEDLLFSFYYLSGYQSRYLQQILTQYPDGKRADEAKFVLDKLMKKQSSPKLDGSIENREESFWSGQSGAKVISLQKKLNVTGYYEAPITGYYGEKTELAVRKFQRKNGLQTTGSPDTNTLALIQRLTPSK